MIFNSFFTATRKEKLFRFGVDMRSFIGWFESKEMVFIYASASRWNEHFTMGKSKGCEREAGAGTVHHLHLTFFHDVHEIITPGYLFPAGIFPWVQL